MTEIVDGDQLTQQASQQGDEGVGLSSPTTPQAPPIVPNIQIDEERLASAFHRLTQQTGQQPTKVERNALATLYQSLQGLGLDEDTIRAQLVAAAQLDQEAKLKAKDEVQEALAQFKKELAVEKYDNLQGRAANFISGIISVYADDEPRLRRLEPAIREEVAQKFNADKARMSEWNRGQLNETALRKIVESAIEDIGKEVLGLDKPKKGLAGKGAGMASAPAAPPAKTEQAVSLEQLDDNQTAFYNATVSSLVNLLGKPRADAEKEAFAKARILPKPHLKRVV